MMKTLVALNLALALFTGAGQADAETTVEQKAVKAQEEYFEKSNQLKSMLFKIKQANYKLLQEQNELLSEPHTLIEIELDEKNDFGWYFYDKNAEFEPFIYVDYETIEHWGIDDMKVGDKITGIFDDDEWELYGFKKF